MANSFLNTVLGKSNLALIDKATKKKAPKIGTATGIISDVLKQVIPKTNFEPSEVRGALAFMNNIKKAEPSNAPLLSAYNPTQNINNLNTEQKFQNLLKVAPSMGKVELLKNFFSQIVAPDAQAYGEAASKKGEELGQKFQEQGQPVKSIVARSLGGVFGTPAQQIGSGIETLLKPNLSGEDAVKGTVSTVFGLGGATPIGAAINSIFAQPELAKAYDSVVTPATNKLKDIASSLGATGATKELINTAIDIAPFLLIHKLGKAGFEKKVNVKLPDPKTGQLIDVKVPTDRAWWAKMKSEMENDLNLLRNNPAEFVRQKQFGMSIKDVSKDDASLPPQSQLKAILDLVPKQKDPQPKVNVYKVDELIREKQNPAPFKLPTGKSKIKLPEQGFPLADVVKMKERGGKTIVTRDELGLMKELPDLEVGKYLRGTFDNPIRTFEKLGEPYKELFYRPVKEAEGNAKKQYEALNKDLSVLEKEAKTGSKKASKRIMEYALSLEPDATHLVPNPPKLTIPEMKAYEFMRDQYDTFLDRLNNARSYAGKDPIPKRPNYFTHIRELEALEDLGFNLGSADVNGLIVRGVHRNSPSFGFEKERQGISKVEMDAFNVFRKYANSSFNYIELTPAISKARELIRTKITDPATKDVFEAKDKSPNTVNFINSWLDTVAGQKADTFVSPLIEQGLQKLNRNIAYSQMSFNLSSMLNQPTAIVSAATEIGPKWAMSGIKDFIAGKGDEALRKSNVLLGRTFESAIKDAPTTKAGKVFSAMYKVGDAGLKPLQIFDAATAKATWLGAYNKAIKEGKNEKSSINYADDVVTKTQASATASDIAPIQRTVAGKTLTLFQTFVINNFNFIKRDVLGIGNKSITKAQAAKKLAVLIAGSWMMNSVYDYLGLPSPLPSPIDAFREEGASGAASELLSLVPVVGGAIKYDAMPYGAVGDLVSDMTGWGKKDYERNGYIGRLLGIPGTSQLKKTVKGKKAIDEGYTVYGDGKKKGTMTPSSPAEKLRALLFGPYSMKQAKEMRRNF